MDVLVTLSQAGFCVGYLIFIADTMTHFFKGEASMSWSPSLGSTLFAGKSLYIWGCLPFQLALNSIATLTHLAPLSIFADVVDLGAMGVVVVDDIIVILKQASEVTAFGGLSVFFYGVGVAVYSFEGIGMALPLESEMKDSHKFGRILGLSMTFIALMYGSFGALGYFTYGKFTKDIITSNMGAGVVTRLVQLGLCINLFFTFPLMMHPVYEIVERRFSSGRYCLCLRWLLVLLVSLVALLVPNFADFLSLVGSSVCCSLGFVLPTLFHLMVFKDELEWHWCAMDILIGIMGVIFAVTGTFYSLVEIFSVTV